MNEPTAGRYRIDGPLGAGGMADAYLVMTQVLGALSFAEGLPLVRRHAEKALQLNPGLAEANTSKAIAQIWVDRDWEGAEHSLQRACGINPNYSPAYTVHATLLNVLGRLDESVAKNRRAVDLDPNSTIARYALSWQLLSSKRYDEALDETAAIQRMDPAHIAVNTVICRLHELRGDYAKAVEMSAVDPAWIGSSPPTDALRRATAAHEGDILFLRKSPLYEPLHGDARFDSILVANRLMPAGGAPGSANP